MISKEIFKRDYGWKYKTEEEFDAAYDRRCRCAQGISLTEEEFIIEAGEFRNPETLKAVYARLAEMAEKTGQNEMLSYAVYGWCLNNPDAIVTYEEGRGVWHVNNCGVEISEDKAKIEVNSEWGFEASRIEIIGTPYYDATDYQFIRFDCGYMTWLWKNGSLYQVYAYACLRLPRCLQARHR